MKFALEPHVPVGQALIGQARTLGLERVIHLPQALEPENCQQHSDYAHRVGHRVGHGGKFFPRKSLQRLEHTRQRRGVGQASGKNSCRQRCGESERSSQQVCERPRTHQHAQHQRVVTQATLAQRPHKTRSARERQGVYKQHQAKLIHDFGQFGSGQQRPKPQPHKQHGSHAQRESTDANFAH